MEFDRNSISKQSGRHISSTSFYGYNLQSVVHSTFSQVFYNLSYTFRILISEMEPFTSYREWLNVSASKSFFSPITKLNVVLV